MKRRSDIPMSAVPGSTVSALIIEWVGRLAAISAVILLALTLQTLQKGRVVQASADQIVDDFHTANDFFADRANMKAPGVARAKLQELAKTLAALDKATATDVNLLSSTVPDVRRLGAAGKGDVRIAKRLQGTAEILKGAAGDLRIVAVDANHVVGNVDGHMARTVSLVQQLNAQLAEIERKLAAVPAREGGTPTSGDADLLKDLLGGGLR
ncbi:hypothetical protein ABZV31_37515 [Streptomyces sp. NPDC005202]|uniref:hypothetical protein n=1 Tax=Streptomyces sp. NPDC005202 TaxID=3157021 RepID=UPI0033AA6866